jgi:hypothetical protein
MADTENNNMDVDVEPPKAKGKKEGGKESGKPRFEVKKVRITASLCFPLYISRSLTLTDTV